VGREYPRGNTSRYRFDVQSPISYFLSAITLQANLAQCLINTNQHAAAYKLLKSLEGTRDSGLAQLVQRALQALHGLGLASEVMDASEKPGGSTGQPLKKKGGTKKKKKPLKTKPLKKKPPRAKI
jgi:hypothetical protein